MFTIILTQIISALQVRLRFERVLRESIAPAGSGLTARVGLGSASVTYKDEFVEDEHGCSYGLRAAMC
jgi:hypothetical protein